MIGMEQHSEITVTNLFHDHRQETSLTEISCCTPPNSKLGPVTVSDLADRYDN